MLLKNMIGHTKGVAVEVMKSDWDGGGDGEGGAEWSN